VRLVVCHDLCDIMPDGALLRATEGTMSSNNTSFEIEMARLGAFPRAGAQEGERDDQ
jgi:hypothetical protein